MENPDKQRRVKAQHIFFGLYYSPGSGLDVFSQYNINSCKHSECPARPCFEMMVFVKVNEDVNSMNWVDDELILLRLDD